MNMRSICVINILITWCILHIYSINSLIHKGRGWYDEYLITHWYNQSRAVEGHGEECDSFIPYRAEINLRNISNSINTGTSVLYIGVADGRNPSVKNYAHLSFVDVCDLTKQCVGQQQPRHWLYLLAATKQLYEWYFLSVRLSVCLSVTPFWLCSHHRINMKFSGVITRDQGKGHAKCQGHRSKVKVTQVTTQRFRTVTPVWIHNWWWNDTYSLMLLKRGALLFLKVIRQTSRSHGAKNRRIWPRLGVSGL